jgi:hypothetical protein
MSFDVRTPIGLLFLIMGGLVAAYGLVAQPLRAGINIDLVWGLVMAAFGLLMVALAWLARRGDLPPPREG